MNLPFHASKYIKLRSIKQFFIEKVVLQEFLPNHVLAWLLLVSRPYIYVDVDGNKKRFLKLSSHIEPYDGSISNLNCAFLSSTPCATYYGRTLQMPGSTSKFHLHDFDGIFTGYSIFSMKEKPKGSTR